MDRVDLNRRSNVKPRLLEAERQATGPSEEINAYGTQRSREMLHSERILERRGKRAHR